MSKFIEIPLMGGLGNQLFQLAAGIEISKVSGRATKYSTDVLKLPASAGTTKRHIGISDLLLPDEVLERSFVSGISRVVVNKFGRSTDR